MNVLLDSLGGEKMYLSQIAMVSGASVSTCHQILEKKVAEGQVSKEKLGNLSRFSLDPNDPLVHQQKVGRTIEVLRPLIEKLKNVSQKITLFGSAAFGSDVVGSDLDIFVLTNDKEQVQKIIRETKIIGRKIRPVIKNFLELMELKKEDPIFFEEINRGNVLWEEKRG